MERAQITDVKPEVEMLARMWMECDPNRGGSDPDEPRTLHIDGVPGEYPRWMWFIPRAEASLKYFSDKGYALKARVTKSTD